MAQMRTGYRRLGSKVLQGALYRVPKLVVMCAGGFTQVQMQRAKADRSQAHECHGATRPQTITHGEHACLLYGCLLFSTCYIHAVA